MSKTAATNLGKPLPIIDLFLNPEREADKLEMLKRAKMEHANTGHIKVNY